jgi:hypothetical protein
MRLLMRLLMAMLSNRLRIALSKPASCLTT